MAKENIKKVNSQTIKQAGKKMFAINIAKDYISKSFQQMYKQVINNPAEKWPKDINRQSTEKKGKMSNKQIKLCHLGNAN